MKEKLYQMFLCLIFLIASNFLQVSADLNSDKQALLQFAASISHSRRLNWNASNPVCSSWIGIACDPAGSRVVSVRLPGIGLAGSIPPESLSRLDALRVLSLRSNLLSGDVPSGFSPSLRLLYLQHNNFSGQIPSTLPPELVVLDLSFNSISGHIPTSLQNLTRLAKLNLQNNALSGEIPTLALPNLKLLNLSYNELNGSIPTALQKHPYLSFIGNSHLCGQPLNPCHTLSSPSPQAPPKPVETRARQPGKKPSADTIIAAAIGCAAALFLAALVTFICCVKRRRAGPEAAKAVLAGGKSGEKPKDFGSGVHDAEKNKLFFFPGCSYSFDLEDLLRASAEILGKGNSGTTYKAVLDEGSTTVVVKRLKEVVVGKREFEQQMEMVASVGEHPNIVPLRAYYYSKDEKLLVYNYMPSGSLFVRLHGFRGAERSPLDWESRVRISLGAARGLAHIHAAGGPRSIHGNIKSSNVLLGPNLEPCVADFGLSPVTPSPAPVISRVMGYRAPESLDPTRRPTQKADVYSFGVLLLETLTGKIPVRYPGHEEVVDLPRWVRSVVREEWTAEVFDVEILRGRHVEEEMVQMLQIALACVAKVAESRPTMDEVVRMIEQLGDNNDNNNNNNNNSSNLNERKCTSASTRPSSESDYSNAQTP